MEIIDNNDICSICFESFDINTSYTLECNHKFHTNCIMKWFRNKNSTCPLCKNTIEYQNLSYYNKITTLSEIKKLGRTKKCPSNIKNILNKIKKTKLKYKEYTNNFKNFKEKYTEELKLYKKFLRDRYKFARIFRNLDRRLLSSITINPIYIKK